MDGVASHLDVEWLAARCASDREPRLSPPAFMHRLVTRARDAGKLRAEGKAYVVKDGDVLHFLHSG
jgi:hypothetical protein